MITREYLDLVRETLHLPSDYALQKPLGLTKQQVSHYRTGRDSLSDATALKVSEICGIDKCKVLLDVHIERAKTPEIRAAWAGLMEKFSTSFNALISHTIPRISPMRKAW